MLQSRAGGVSPRGMHPAHANSKRRNSSHWNCRRGLQTHGGLTPVALGCVDDSRRTLRHSSRTARVMRTTAGSRPPLLVTCIRASQTSFFSPADVRTPTQERGGVSPSWPAIVRDTTNRRNTIAAGNRIRTSDWEKADSQRQRLHRGPLRSKPPEVEPFHTPGETDRCVFTPYIPRQPRLRGPAIHLPKPLAALLRHIFGMAGVKATLRNWGGDYNGMLSRVS
jgi:hypothetical protein